MRIFSHCVDSAKKVESRAWWLSKRAFTLLLLLLIATFATANSTLQKNVIKEFSVTNVTLEECLKILEKKASIGLYYNAKEIAAAPRVTVNIKNETLEKVLDQIFSNSGFEYSIKSGTVVVRKKSSGENSSVKVAKGFVYNENGEPIPGATVKIQNTQIGTATAIDGSFAIQLPDGSKEIAISFIGYETALQTISSSIPIKITLKESRAMINEVVVTGFSTISKERSTGSVAVIKSEDLERKVELNLTSTLEGKVAGLNSYNGSNVIRGITSFRSDKSPLVVVDGLPIEGTLNDINVSDVESVTVLKDAAAASIYGTRAGNGIFVVTTKSGKKGKTAIDFSSNFYISRKPRISDFNYASTADIVDYERYYLENDPNYKSNPLKYFENKNEYQQKYSLLQNAYYKQLQGLITIEERDAEIEALKKYDYKKEFEKYAWQNSLTQQYNLAFRKGDEKLNLAFSVNYNKQKYSTVGSNSDNVVLNFKSSSDLYKWLNVTLGVYGSLSKSKSGIGGGGATSQMPYERIMNDNGERNQIVTINYPHNDYISTVKGLYGMGYNPLDEMEQSYKKTDDQMLRAFADLNFKLLKGLTYEVKFLYQHTNKEAALTYLKESLFMRDKINKFASLVTSPKGTTVKYRIPNNGRLNTITNNNYSYTRRNQVAYNENLTNDLALSAFAGTEFRELNTKGIANDIYGYDPNVMLKGQVVNWFELSEEGVYGELYPKYRYKLYPNQFSEYSLNREFSLYANGSLSYKGKYVVAGSWRVDQTNLFGVAPENKYRPLWSVSASWNASEEEFLKKYSWLNMLKIRVSKGINGNVDRSSSPYMLASLEHNVEVNRPATSIDSPPNPNLRWEKTDIFNAGIDFSVLNRKLSGSVDFYNKYTSDLIVSEDVDPSTGFSTALVNNGEMLNRGIEVNLNYSWIQNRSLEISTGFILAYNYNEIKKISQQPSYASQLIDYPGGSFKVGYPYNSLYAYRYAGLTANGDPSVYDKDGNIVENTSPMKDPNALVYLGKYDPPTTGSISQLISYKGFTLDALLVFYAGHKLRLDAVPLYGQAEGSMMAGITDRWTPTNTDTDIPRFPVFDGTGDRADFWRYADKHVVSASTVKLRNVGLSYRLSNDLLRRVSIKAIQLKAQVNNLWYWAACGNGIDPENYDARGATRYGANKPTYIFSVNLNF